MMADQTTATGLRVPRKLVVSDLVSGFVMAVISVPGALANGVLAGVNPVFGLSSMVVGTTVPRF
jgi:SulP family sulfate permease